MMIDGALGKYQIHIMTRTNPLMYLHLCCEGWQTFGPYQWLSLQDAEGVIVDESGTVIARRDKELWRATDPRFKAYLWRNPTITVGAGHPHPNSGSHPNYPN